MLHHARAEKHQNKVIFLENIEKNFSGVCALKNVSFGIEKSRIHCLAGENGSGKSTLIKVISGVCHPDSGRVYIDGYEYSRLNPIDAIANGIQVIYQDFSLFPKLSVAENIAINWHVKNKSKVMSYSESKKIARLGLQKINVDIDLDKSVEDLSVADKQLVAIARAISFEDSKLIIMDEPTTALTHQEIDRLLDIILTLKEHGIAILFVSHKLRELTDVSDTLTILRNGEKVAEGPNAGFTEKTIAAHMIGRELDTHNHVPNALEHKPLLEVNGIGYKKFFHDISFKLNRGEIIGITGLLGCGRTEIALSLFGVLPVESGGIKINNQEVSIRSIQNARRYGIGYVPEDRLTEGLFLTQSILNNTIVSSFKRFLKTFGRIDFPGAREAVRQKIAELKLNTQDISMPVQNLSGGNQQRVVIAKWLCTEVQILILNGPTVGVDIGSKFEIHRKLREIAQQGLGIIIISDDLSELLENCDKILLIHKGCLEGEFENNGHLEQNLLDAYDRVR